MPALRALFWSSRPVSWINTAFPFAAAYFFVTRELNLEFWLGTLFFLVPYNLLMYGINDVFDYESDLRNPRKGGIEGALLKPEWHRLTIWSAVLLSAPFVIALSLLGSLESTLWLLLFCFTVVAYSAPGLRFKERPFLDSITSSSHFFGPMVFGLSLTGSSLSQPSTLFMIAAFALWGVASHAFGAVQDVKADREGGISSIATVIGARATVRFALLCYTLAGVLMLFTPWPAPLVAMAAIPYLVIVAPFFNIDDASCELANRGWRRFIWLNYFAGFIVTIILIVAIIWG